MAIDQRIVRFLAAPDTCEAVAAELSRAPQESFHAIIDFRGPYPEGMHPIDAHEDHLTQLLAELLKRCPSLLIGPDPVKMPKRSFIVIAAAIAANDPRFSETILSALTDRSIYMKLAAVDGIVRRAYLRTPAVRKQLLGLQEKKSISRDEYVMQRLKEAINMFDQQASS